MPLPLLLDRTSRLYHLLNQMVANMYNFHNLPWHLSKLKCTTVSQLSTGSGISFSTFERLCDTGNGSIPAPAVAKPAGQANGRPPASQQWQSPQTSPGPPANKPMPQDIPATPETIKMSSEFKVQPCTKAPLLHRQSLLVWHVMVLHACYTV